jgi:hypothetical protein
MGVTSSWEPNSVPRQPPDQPVQPETAWVPSGAVPQMVETRSTPAQEQWVYVDPDSYSDPFTAEPVYTSGAQPIPVAVPPGPVPAPPEEHPANGSASLPPAFVQTPSSPLGGYGIAPPEPSADPTLAANYEPEKGELKIKERRSWRTWQLVAVALLAAVLGMWFNGNAGSASGTAGGSGSGYKLPPAGSAATATTSAGSSAASGASSSTTTTAAGGATAATGAGSTETTVAGGSSESTPTSSPVAVGPATVLVPEVQQAGNWTSPAFTIAGGTWNIGWAFQCAPAPSAPPSFEIFVVNNGAAPGSTPAVTSSAASGQAVTPQTSTGSQQIIVQTSAACRWAAKVTGASS